MKITITGRQMTVHDSMKEMAFHKMAKLDRVFGEAAEATVTFRKEPNLEIIEITIFYDGELFRSEERAETFANAMDRAVDKLAEQMRRYRSWIVRQVKGLSVPLPEQDDEPEHHFQIRIKTFTFKPMYPEEAVLQMNLLEHDFFVFVNAETDKTCVVYRRRDGNYGMICPDN